MRIDILAVVAALAFGCAHNRPPPAPVAHIPELDYYVPGDERVPVRSPDDLVYRIRGR